MTDYATADSFVDESLLRDPCPYFLRSHCPVGREVKVSDDQHRVPARELADEIALALVNELVDGAPGEFPHVPLALLEPLRRDEAHQEPPAGRVPGRGKAADHVAERPLLDRCSKVMVSGGHR